MTEDETRELLRIADRARTKADVIQGIPIYVSVWDTLINISFDINRLVTKS